MRFTPGLPAGVTAAFNPNPTTTTSTLTLTASATATTGTVTVTITGTSGSLTNQTTIQLTVNSSSPADFSISAAPPSLTLARGSHGTYTATVTALNGFTGTVTLSVSGLPANTIAKFNPTSITGSGNATLAVGPQTTTPTGTFTVTITGTSGSLVHSTTVSLTVN